MNKVLEKLDLDDLNLGASTGPDAWIRDPNEDRLVSVNPTMGEPIAAVLWATTETCDQVVSLAREALGFFDIITAFNSPVSAWSCDTMIWKPSSSTPLAAVAVQRIADRIMADHGLRDVFNLAKGNYRSVKVSISDNEAALESWLVASIRD